MDEAYCENITQKIRILKNTAMINQENFQKAQDLMRQLHLPKGRCLSKD